MIGWFVDYGWFDNSDGKFNLQTNPPTLSDINFMDFHRPYSIPMVPSTSSPISEVVLGLWDIVNADKAATFLLNYFGNDYYYIHGAEIYKPESSVQFAIYNPYYILPTIPETTPNLVGVTTPSRNWTFAIYFKKQKLVSLCSRTSIGSDNYWYIVGNDGKLTKVVENSNSPETRRLTGSLNSEFSFWYIIGNIDNIETWDFSNLYGFYSQPANRTGTGMGYYMDSVKVTAFNADMAFKVLRILFSVDPDYTGGPDNPYGPGGDSGEGGGDGTFDDDSDPIEIPSKPTLSSANTGFTRIYNPTLSQVQDLANYLWTDESVIQTIWNHIKQFFENPMDAIIGFNLVPVPVPDGGTENFKLMYIDTGVSMTVAANQFVDVDCGSLTLEQYYGSALDYSPYTKVSCFLPYVGNVSLNVDEVMGRTLHVTYRVDICSGSCVAYISVDGTVLYQYSGHCAIPIPLSSADFSSYVNSAIAVGKLAGAALIGGAGAAMMDVGSEAAQQTNQVVTTTQTTATSRNPNTGRQITDWTRTVTRTQELPPDQSSTKASFSGLTPQNIANTVGQIMSSKPYIEHSGSFSGNSGYLGVRRPYVIIERPNMCMPADYQQLNGFPSMITLSLGGCSGFTKIQQVQLTGVTATNPEQAEILELLKMGVIL